MIESRDEGRVYKSNIDGDGCIRVSKVWGL